MPGGTGPNDGADWRFDVATSDHDAVRAGLLAQRWSRVVVSRAAYPDWRAAAEVAAALAVAVHGGLPTEVRPRL